MFGLILCEPFLEFVDLEHGHASSRKLLIFNQSSEVLSFQAFFVNLFSLLYSMFIILQSCISLIALTSPTVPYELL